LYVVAVVSPSLPSAPAILEGAIRIHSHLLILSTKMAFRQPYLSSPSETRVDLTSGHDYDDDLSTNDHSNYGDSKFRSSLSIEDPPTPRTYEPNQFLSPHPPNSKPSASISSLSLNDGAGGRSPYSGDGVDWQPNPRSPAADKQTFMAQVFPKSSMACRLYLITVLVETILDIAIESLLLQQVNAAVDAEESHLKTGDKVDGNKARLPVYLAIFTLAHLFQAALALDAVYNRNTLQFIFLAIFNALLGVYAIIQIGEVKTLLGTEATSTIPINVLTITICVVVGLAEVAYIAFAYQIYGEFGWLVYKQIGANRRMKGIYGQYQVYQSLVRFSTFFWLGFSVQLIALVLERTDFEFYVTIVALPLSMLLLFEGHLAARHESKWMMGTFLMGCVAALIYFIYKLFRILTQRNSDIFKSVYKSLSAFATISIMLLIITCIWAVLVLRNFDQGLKSQLSINKPSYPPIQPDELEMGGAPGTPGLGRKYPASSNPSRMSIE